MGKDKSSFFWWHSLFLCTEFIKELSSHGLEHRPEHGPTKDQGRLISRQTVTECWHVTVAEPPTNCTSKKHSKSIA